jgi:hypothetical protein
MPKQAYRAKPEFRDETERLIWSTAFATYPILAQLRPPVPFQNEEFFEAWSELARNYADQVLTGFRETTGC